MSRTHEAGHDDAFEIPAGFAPHQRKSALTNPWEPIYARQSPERVILGLLAREAHCNGRGLVHGGLMAALGDNAMGLSCVTAALASGRSVTGLLTASLQIHYLGRADVGQWLTFETEFVKLGKTLSFADLVVRADGRPVAKASASFSMPG
jgi:uncharacterized protein (TIGR00369 family)